MAGVTKVNGDMGASAVANFFGGSKIAFFGMIVKNGSNQAVDMSGEGGVNEAWEAIYKAISLKATPVLFQYESGSTGAASWGIEQNGAGWTAADLQTAIRALGTTVGGNNVDMSLTTVTDVGFKLAVS
jgi:hypothetical protein